MNKTKSVLMVVFILILLGFLGFIAWKYHGAISGSRMSQEASVSQAALAPMSTTTPGTSSVISASVTGVGTGMGPATYPSTLNVTAVSAPIAPQAGWTAYDDDQYAVQGTYPQAWYEYDAVSLGGSLQFTSVPQSQATVGGMVMNGAAEIAIYRTPETVAQAEAEDLLNGVQEAKTAATVAGQSVEIIAYAVAGSQSSMVAYVPHGGYVYRVDLEDHGESRFGNIYSNFLSTLRFAD
jgi:hypothetical protein